MAKRTTKKVNNNELDGQEFFAAIAQIEQEKGIKPGYMMEKITQALVSAYRRDHEGVGDNLIVDANPETNTVRMFLKKDVVEVVDNPNTEISLQEAKAALPRAELGDVVRIEVKPKSFGRIAAQTARQVIISRTHPGLVKRLFELEVPEIYDGTVEIRSIAREAGSRTKLAVWSADPNVDPIGACVGPRGQRVNTIVEELKGEKMDIIKYSDDPAEYIAAALSPADVVSVEPLPDGKSCRVVVPDDQLSLAIGKEGQNARLAAKLTGWKIDIKPASAPLEPIEELQQEELEDDALVAEEPVESVEE